MANIKNKHYLWGTKFYNTWSNMKGRCYNKSHHKFKIYGGRGIIVCNEWLQFINFKNDMYKSYLEHCQIYGEKNTTIDRKDNNKGYFLDNCHWTTLQNQANNRNSNHLLTFNGQTLNITQWGKKFNLPGGLISWRIINGKWSIEKALTTPIRKMKKH